MSEKGKESYIGLNGKPIKDESDWDYVRNMSDEEALRNALDDPDAQPRNPDDLRRKHDR